MEKLTGPFPMTLDVRNMCIDEPLIEKNVRLITQALKDKRNVVLKSEGEADARITKAFLGLTEVNKYRELHVNLEGIRGAVKVWNWEIIQIF